MLKYAYCIEYKVIYSSTSRAPTANEFDKPQVLGVLDHGSSSLGRE
jgi:hypothetical protein